MSEIMIGRDRERRALERALTSPESEFVAVYGRRRVGKTFLVRQFFGQSFTFYASGLDGGGKAAQLDTFHEGLRRYGHPDPSRPADWMEAFRRLADLIDRAVGPGKKVVFLDELPWFDTPRSGFLAALDHFWNVRASARDDVILVACGSATSWMATKLLKNKGGLHNRVTIRIPLSPFTLAECEQFFASRGVVLTRYQMAEAYMVFGGVPFYLRQFDRTAGLAQNIDALYFAPEGPLRQEFEILFSSLFGATGHHRRFVEILAATSKGLTRDELIRAARVADGGTITATLADLELSGFVRRALPFGTTKKGTLFQLSDFFSRFHLSFLTEPPDGTFWTRFATTPAHSAWAGPAFEQVAAAHIPQLKHALGIPAVHTTQASWRTRAADGRPGAQIDLVIDRDDGVINLCEMKWARRPYELTADDTARLVERRETFRERTKTAKALHLTMLTPYGLAQNAYAGEVQQDLALDALFTPA
ncbi:MAG: hypothetical protein LBR19_04455 [Bifidobacteriaceae bacterium]|nr:hypothetical protein [Bifidobacteriaceae bacterium]